MEDYLVRIFGEIQAEVVVAMGMQADNKQREILGQSMAYTSEDFNNVAADIKSLVDNLR